MASFLEFGPEGINKDIGKAFDYYVQSAELNYKTAIERVIFIYNNLAPTADNIEKLIYWDKKLNNNL